MAEKLDLSDVDESKIGKLCPFRAMPTGTSVKFLPCIGERCELWAAVGSWHDYEKTEEGLKATSRPDNEGCSFRIIAEGREPRADD
jgi:hypothetical protein